MASLCRATVGAFLVYRNYDALLDYNCAHSYALSVALLADRLLRVRGGGGVGLGGCSRGEACLYWPSSLPIEETRPFDVDLGCLVDAHAAAATAILLLRQPAAAQRPATAEGAVKAAFLYNFTKFIEWPAAAFRTVRAVRRLRLRRRGVPQGARPASSSGEQVRGRPIAIVAADARRPARLSPRSTSAGRASRRAAAADADAVKRSPVLTVGEGRPLPRTGRPDRVHARGRSRALRRSAGAAPTRPA